MFGQNLHGLYVRNLQDGQLRDPLRHQGPVEASLQVTDGTSRDAKKTWREDQNPSPATLQGPRVALQTQSHLASHLLRALLGLAGNPVPTNKKSKELDVSPVPAISYTKDLWRASAIDWNNRGFHVWNSSRHGSLKGSMSGPNLRFRYWT